jgi:hypothetical protein
MADPKTEMHPVASSMASHAGYDAPTQTLHVKFVNGKTFAYAGVPDDKAHTVLGAASFGAALNKHVLPKHTGKRVG